MTRLKPGFHDSNGELSPLMHGLSTDLEPTTEL